MNKQESPREFVSTIMSAQYWKNGRASQTYGTSIKADTFEEAVSKAEEHWAQEMGAQTWENEKWNSRHKVCEVVHLSDNLSFRVTRRRRYK